MPRIDDDEEEDDDDSDGRGGGNDGASDGDDGGDGVGDVFGVAALLESTLDVGAGGGGGERILLRSSPMRAFCILASSRIVYCSPSIKTIWSPSSMS